MALTGTPIPTIKLEHGGAPLHASEIKIKPDPDGRFPGAPLDEDIYEDTGDLDFSTSNESIYLTRIPKYLWQAWSEAEDEQEIQIGTVRVEGGLENPKRMSLLLASDVLVNAGVPKEYNLNINKGGLLNTFVFTEKDTPGYANRIKNRARSPQDSASLPFAQAAPRLQFQDRSRYTTGSGEKKKKWSPYRKAVPKKTALTGRVDAEINCLPVENEDFKRTMAEITLKTTKPKRETQILKGVVSSHAGNLLAPGTLGAPGSFSNFIKGTGTNKAKSQESKASRMPLNELLDLIHDCFKKYEYWPLKVLKNELKQPEAYLKQTLERVAHLVRQGPHAMTWQIKPEFKSSVVGDAHSYDEARDKEAPDDNYGLNDDSEMGTEEDDDGVKLEDVMPK